LTLFAYFAENDVGKISKDTLINKMNINIKCGFLSYAESPKPKYYSRILGVTGTLASLHPQMISTLKEYNINVQTFAPSIFGATRVTWNKTS
jgi:hypothetical protein